MFPGLPAHNPTDAAIKNLSKAIPALPDENPDNAGIRAGFTFLGQFIDHDITFDASSPLIGQNDPNAHISAASAKLDLDSIYDAGPVESPQYYDPNDSKKIRLVVNSLGVLDVPRDQNNKALLPDSRNDQTVILLQLHIAFCRFHNAMVDHVRSQGVSEDDVFETARRLVRWHYQWVVVKHFLPTVAHQTVVGQVLVDVGGIPTVQNLYYNPTFGNPYAPVEFTVAAYRAFHSIVRDRYRVNPLRSSVGLLGRFDNSLIGGRQLPPDLVIEWQNFFPIPGISTTPQATKKLDRRLSNPLKQLPLEVYAVSGNRNLAERNMLRARSFGLPAGQDVAAFMGQEVIPHSQFGLPDTGWEGKTPLWFYILGEAEFTQNGSRLGPVGARIVTEVLLGMMAADPDAYLAAEPTFQPAPPIAPSLGNFAMGDLLKFAGAA
jgi:hypothetical protein